MNLKVHVQLDLLILVLNNMRRFAINDLYDFLQIPDSEVAKFNEINDSLNIDYLKKLFYESEDEFFEYVENNLNEEYLKLLYIYLNLAVDLYYDYKENNIAENIYFDTIDDIRIWINNCIKETNTYGLKEIYWINEHLRMRIFKLGRLQFQKREATEFMDLLKQHTLDKFIKKDYFYFVHIPEGERLSYDLVLDSYQKAIEFFKDEMVFACESWMLSDRLELIFNNDSNVLKFRNDYILLNQIRDENHIKRYLKEGSRLADKVNSLEKDGIMIGEGFGICLNYIERGV